MTSFLFHADDILRRRSWTTESGQTRWALQRLSITLVLFGVLYGAAMGTFGGVRGERLLQVVYSAAKVPLLLVVTFVIGLPSFFVINTLFGLRRDLSQAVRADRSASRVGRHSRLARSADAPLVRQFG